MMVVAIDHADVFARAAPTLLALPQVKLITAKPIALCKWRGHRTPAPARSADTPPWSRITLYTCGETLLAWRPAHLQLVDDYASWARQASRRCAAQSATHSAIRCAQSSAGTDSTGHRW